MTTAIEYALMAGAVYVSTRDVLNQIPTPPGWLPFNYQSLPSGFEAASFRNGGDIVISFAGTGTAVDWLANIGGAFGVTTTQLEQAAAYYLGVKAANPGASISFTGHSLGGGLASLMAVFFSTPGNNLQAVTFDQAPFANSATVSVATTLENYLSGLGYSASALQGLTSFISAANSSPGSIPNASNVIDFNVQGEILSSLSYVGFGRIGAQTDIANSSAGASAVDLHSQALLSAFMLSDQTAATQTLDAVTFQLTDLLKMIFDPKLFAHPENTGNSKYQNFIDLIVQHQEGFSGIPASVPTGTTPTVPTTAAIAPDKMVTRFTADLWQIAQAGGLTMNDKNITDALIAFAMQSYYEGANSNDPSGKKHFFKSISGGLEFAITDVGKKGTLGDAKGYSQYFVKAISDNTDPNNEDQQEWRIAA